MNEEAKYVLKEMMGWISESTWAAGWVNSLEFILWEYVQNPQNLFTEAEGKALFWLAEQAGGWWIWDRRILNQRFVPMDEWLRVYCQWEKEQKERQT